MEVSRPEGTYSPREWSTIVGMSEGSTRQALREGRLTASKDSYGRRWIPEAEIVLLPEGTIPPLIDRLTFERAQARLGRNKSELARPSDSTDTLLRGGFVFCGSCGRRMVVKRSTHKRRKQVRYICQYRDTCRLHVITASILDEGVWSRVSAILAEPERLRAVLSEPSRDFAGEIAAIDGRIEELRREESGLTRLGGSWKRMTMPWNQSSPSCEKSRHGDACWKGRGSGCNPRCRTRRYGSVG
jgi:hypothetical protein